MEKKAELTTQQIVLIVLLVISFAVVLIFIVRLNLKEVSDKETKEARNKKKIKKMVEEA